MARQGSMIFQVQQALLSQMKIGESRHEAKIKGGTKTPVGIYSYCTFEVYFRECCKFALWAQSTHHCNTLQKAQSYIEEYLQSGMDRGLSASTLSTQRASICKLYGLSAFDLDIKLPERKRGDIVRSRNVVARDYGFSETKHADIINFARATGLRRHELAAVKPSQIHIRPDGMVELRDVIGKGGKVRTVMVVPGMEDAVSKFARESKKRIFKVPSHMDVHSYRREYATAMYISRQAFLYKREGRDFRNLPPMIEAKKMFLPDGSYRVERKEVSPYYYCKKDKKGIVYDKLVMAYVSHQLGHARIDVIAGHYI